MMKIRREKVWNQTRLDDAFMPSYISHSRKMSIVSKKFQPSHPELKKKRNPTAEKKPQDARVQLMPLALKRST